jgi:hypothetical protein
MIIKRWNGSAFVEEYPKTIAPRIFNSTNTDPIFDGYDKIKPAYLPNSVFDSLYFSTNATPGNTKLRAVDAIKDGNTLARSPLGFYWVVSTAGNLTSSSTATVETLYTLSCTYTTLGGSISTADTSNLRIGMIVNGANIPSNSVITAIDQNGVNFTINATPTLGGSGVSLTFSYSIATFITSGEESQVGSTVTTVGLEVGDWFVISKVTGDGSVAGPYQITFAVVNNTYELADTSVYGITRLSSRTTYASLSGNNVVGETTLKTVIDNAAFASGTHVHGNITNDGKIGSTATLPIITGASGVLTAGSFGTTAGTFAQGNDSRLSDARTPTAHTHGNITNVGAIGSTANLPIITTTSGVLTAGSFGTTANTFTQGNDSRLSDARTPTSHVHGDITNAGAITSTVITPATGDAIILSDTSASDALKRGISIGTSTTTFLRNDGTWGTPVDTNTTYSVATSTVLGLVELFSDTQQAVAANAVSATSLRTYGVQLNSNNQAVVNVPWTDTDTVATVTALGGLSATSNSFQMVHPFFVQADAPATPLTGTIWFDI